MGGGRGLQIHDYFTVLLSSFFLSLCICASFSQVKNNMVSTLIPAICSSLKWMDTRWGYILMNKKDRHVFRQYEFEWLKELHSKRWRCLDPKNRERIQQAGKCIWLDLPVYLSHLLTDLLLLVYLEEVGHLACIQHVIDILQEGLLFDLQDSEKNSQYKTVTTWHTWGPWQMETALMTCVTSKDWQHIS